jgi:methylglutamate dehydrogenase subunit D
LWTPKEFASVADLSINTREGFGLASIAARKDVPADTISRRLRINAPSYSAFVSGADISLIGTGPRTWLAHTDHVSPGWFDDLRARLEGRASVSDQSSAYVIQRLGGTDARKLLQRGASINFEPDAFGAGSAAATLISHIGVLIWQLDDKPTYDVATFRSYADCFRGWLCKAARAL